MTHYVITRQGMKGFFDPKPQGQLLATLNKQLSFEKPGKQFMPNPAWALVRLYKFENGSFPWGLWSRVIKILNKNREVNGDTWDFISSGCVDYALRMEDVSSKLRQYQMEAIIALHNCSGGILCMPTGSGKTVTALSFLKATRLEATVIVHTRDLKKQWETAAAELGVKVKVITYQSPIAAEYIKLTPVIIFDECHHVAAKTVYALAGKCKEKQIRIGLSATPWREDGCDLLIEAALGPIVYNVIRSELIKEGFLVNANVYYLEVPKNPERFLTYQDEYLANIVHNDVRNELISRTAFELGSKGKRVLILVNHIEHGDNILKEYTHNSLHYWPSIVFVHGKMIDRVTPLKQAQIVIASQIFNEGVDFPDLDVLIIAGGGKSSIRVTQQVGRVLRQRLGKRDAIIVDFMDSSRHLSKHYKKRRLLLEEEFSVTEGLPNV